MRPRGIAEYVGAVFALFTVVSGQQQIPQCAAKCLESSLKAQTVCAPTNMTCICTDEPLQKAIQTCVLSSCTVVEALAAQNATETMCGRPVRDITQITPIVSGVSGGLAIMAVLARCIAVGRNFAIDDVHAVLALLSALPMGILEFPMSYDGFGKDIWTIPPEKISRIIMFTWLTEIFYFIALTFAKISFLYFCLRIFPRRALRQRAYILIWVCVAYGLAFTLSCVFNCTPVSYIWHNWDGQHEGTCINFHIFAACHAAVNILLDILVLALPMPELLKLSMSQKNKIYVIMMFSIGIFTTVISIVRLRSLVKFAKSANPTWDSVPTAYWSVLEAFVSIFCVCMPALRRFLAIIFPSCFGSTQGSSRYANYNDMGPDLPNKVSDSARKNSKPSMNSWRKFGLDTGITKTMETHIESRAYAKEDDEVMLVEMGRGLPAVATSRV
ncbi:hypothetical protein yc1106_08799 [Curvularia clavata]|uniref:CFEM domain-containing protein n=1 Tax=Curvularia clavata TaxID=95742 RepID=A0A9Q8ZG04_CURCL|nr:hypothetical protein yc1106_08799 [Curvularia clavata]